MARRRHPQPPDAPTAEPDQPTLQPARFMIQHHEGGEVTLGVREGEYEQRYTLPDPYTRALFIALCRHGGAKLYRRRRQRESTVCVMASPSLHDALWARFLVLSDKLEARLAEVAQEFVHSEVCTPGGYLGSRAVVRYAAWCCVLPGSAA